MKFPRIKNALLCRILVYVVVLGGFITPMVIIALLNFIPSAIKIIGIIGLIITLLIYIMKNLMVLMAVDYTLATLHCHNTARKRFVLPESFSIQKVERKIARFGDKCDPISVSPLPHSLRYKFEIPLTVYSCGIEKVIATYHVDLLDNDLYHNIINSAVANSKALKGTQEFRFPDKQQKKAPLNRITLIIIFANQVEDKFRNDLFNTVCQNGGDGITQSTLPCVVDLQAGFATFDSIRIPYVGSQYPAKTRGIKLIRKYLFNNKFTLADSPDTVDAGKKFDMDQSLWSFWASMKKELTQHGGKSRRSKK